MAKGGKRSGAGRPPGARNKRTQRLLDAAEASGLMPAELLLRTARGLPTPGVPRPTMEQIIAARVAAAPYYHPRLAAVVARVNEPSNPWKEILNLVEGKSRSLINNQGKSAMPGRDR